MEEFRIVDLRDASSGVERVVIDKTPEGAACGALKLLLIRAGSPSRLLCKVYWTSDEVTNMVRLYEASA